MLRYQVGDVIVYNGEGVCRVEAVGIPELSGLEKQKEYYTLVPLYHEGTSLFPWIHRSICALPCPAERRKR